MEIRLHLPLNKTEREGRRERKKRRKEKEKKNSRHLCDNINYRATLLQYNSKGKQRQSCPYASHEDIEGNRGIVSLIANFGTRQSV